jgi:HD-GYP domain-containing protein (c-di-GMP phosphodiesterase class II)
MDMLALTRPHISDRDAVQDLSDAVKEHARAIERDIVRLKRNAGDSALVAELFRAVHNIKGDAALARFTTAVLVVHPLESLLTQLRAREIMFSEMLAEVILLSIDRIELAIESALADRPLAPLELPTLVQGLERLATLGHGGLEGAAADLIAAVTGFRPASLRQFNQPDLSAGPVESRPGRPAADLEFFQLLARQLDRRASFLAGRSTRVTHLALATNAAAGNPIDRDQLQAAALIHDIGMMFLPDKVWLKLGKLSNEETQVLQQHPFYAAGLLERMPGWAEAARMVREHHEMPGGGGYPRQLGSDAICPGAKLLAIVDAFEAVMQKHSHRGRSRSGLRAAAEINANPAQFAPEWIEPFNHVIRQILER